MTLKSPSSLAIFRLSALGDVCLTVPLVRLIQQHFPATRLYWIISRACYPLVENLSGVEFIVIDKPRTVRDYWRCYRKLRPYQFDILLVPQATWRSNIMGLFIRACVKYGYDRLHSQDMQRWFVRGIVPSHKEHLLDSFLRFTEPLGILNKTIDTALPLTEKDWQRADELLKEAAKKRLAVCLSASRPVRNWPVSCYIDTIRALQERWRFNVILVGGNSDLERRRAEELVRAFPSRVLNLVGQTDVKELTAILGKSDVLLSPDSGPVHLANALRTPVVGLYAASRPKKTGPYFYCEYVVNYFNQACELLLRKNPDTVSWHHRFKNDAPMRLIPVDCVVAQLHRVFEELAFEKNTKSL